LKRLATAAVGLPVLVVIIKYLNPWFFFALVCIAGVLATHELHALARQRSIEGNRTLGALLSLGVLASFVDERVSLAAVLAAAVVLVPVLRLLKKDGVEGALESISVTLAGIIFVGIPLGYLIALMGQGDEIGRDLIIFLFLVVWLADAGAYYVGSAIGKHPLSPTISPNKTMEGAAGGLAMSLVAATMAKVWFFQGLAVRDVVLLSILLWAAGMLGDLAESLLKRAAAVKDCGTLFPGHGGMLDRTDSLLFGAPVLFFYYKAFLA
jgi:phosphatidate cytidylyltransferase